MPASPKPEPGSLKRYFARVRRGRTKAERREMDAALDRDGRRCRVPSCTGTPIDPCHLVHRGMGGNPTGTRTTRATIISLCRPHHDQYDRKTAYPWLDIEPLTGKKFSGPCSYYRVNRDGSSTYLGGENTR